MAFTVVALLTCGAAGVLLGRAIAPGDSARVAPIDTLTLSTGPVEMDLPAGWTRSRPAPIPGLQGREITGARDASLGTQVALGILPYESPTLLPRRLIEGVVPLPRPRPILIQGRLRAYDYAGLVRPGARGVLDVLALPTTRGIATVVCISPAELGPAPECSTLGRSLRLAGARPVRLDAATAFRARLPAELSVLERERELARARVSHGDPRATFALAAAFRRAATALARVAPASEGAPALVIRALAAEGDAYRRLANALMRGSRSRALRARGRIPSLEAELRRRVAAQAG